MKKYIKIVMLFIIIPLFISVFWTVLFECLHPSTIRIMLCILSGGIYGWCFLPFPKVLEIFVKDTR